MDSSDINHINDLLKDGKVSDAKERLNNIVSDNSADYWLLKGNVEQRHQNWGVALNAFFKVLEIDKNNQEALNNIHIIQNIINFWNPEMFNP